MSNKKIYQIYDSSSWAINKLAQPMRDFNPQYEWRVDYIHPKDLEQGKVDLAPIIENIKWADLIDCHYWRVLSQLLDMVPELKDKKILLTHHNEKNIFSYEWPDNVSHMTRTKRSEKLVKEKYSKSKVFFTHNSYNPEQFQFMEEWKPKGKIVGYVGRVVPWKGLKDIAKACYELKYPLMLMGKMDKPSYWAEIPQEHRENIDLSYLNCEDNEVLDFYKEITIYVGNSGSGRETGPLGLIESMALGVPCVTTLAGIANDICIDDDNCLLVDYDDYDQLKMTIERLMETPALQGRLRRSAWDSIRNHTHERVAIEYNKAYVKILNDKPLVSVVIPATFERTSEVCNILQALGEQTYPCIEAIIVWDEFENQQKENDKSMPELSNSYPVKQIYTNKEGYNLAMARNMGVIESSGKYIMFCDSRLLPMKHAVEHFIRNVPEDKKKKWWLFGEKGGEKKHFVENFSFIRRQDLIWAGLFNERVDRYGGMSQELRERFSIQGFELKYVPEAEAVQMLKSGLSPAKRLDIQAMKTLLTKLGLN